MPISEIYQWAMAHGVVPQPGFQEQTIHYGVFIRKDGSILAEAIGGKDGHAFMCPTLTPDEMQVGRPKNPPPTSGCPGTTSRHFLWDIVDVITDGSDLKWKHQSFLEFLDRAASNGVKDAGRIADVLRNRLPEVRRLLEECHPKPTAKVTFNVDGRWVVEEEDWKEWWESERARINAIRHKSERIMISVASGKPVSPEQVHQAIKGVSGSMTQGSKMVCMDKPAFQSYGLRGGEHAPLSEMEERIFNKALSKLVKKSVAIPGSNVVFWYEKCNKDIEDDIQARFLQVFGSGEAIEQEKISALRDLLVAVESGKRPMDPDASYTMLVLSGVESRLMIRSLRKGNVIDMLRNVNQWFDDVQVMTENGPSPTYKLAKYLYAIFVPPSPSKRMSDYVPNHCAFTLLDAAISGRPIPPVFQQRAILKHKSLLHSTDSGDRAWRMCSDLVAVLGLLKAILTRKGFTMSETCQSFGFQWGRLVAAYEEIQRTAIPSVGATTAESHWSAIVNRPASVWNQMKMRSQAHVRKIRGDMPGVAMRLDAEASAIVAEIGSIGPVPQTLNMDQQTQVIIGYETQKSEYNKARIEGWKAKKDRENQKKDKAKSK